MQGFIQKDYAKLGYYQHITNTNDLGFAHEFWLYAGARVFCVLFAVDDVGSNLRYFLYRRESGDYYEVHLRHYCLPDLRTVYHISVPNLRIVLRFSYDGKVEFYEDYTEGEWRALTEYFQPSEFSNYPIVYSGWKFVADDLGTIAALYTEESERVYDENENQLTYTTVSFTFYEPNNPQRSVADTRAFVLADGHALRIQPPPSQQAISVYDVHADAGEITELWRFGFK